MQVAAIGTVDILPEVLFRSILSFLEHEECLAARAVCRRWTALYTDATWKHVYLSRFTPDTSLCKSVCPDGRKTLWKKRFFLRCALERHWQSDRYQKRTFTGHSGAIRCIQFDDFRMVSGSEDCTIKMWDMSTGALLRTLNGPNGHTGHVCALQFEVWDHRTPRSPELSRPASPLPYPHNGLGDLRPASPLPITGPDGVSLGPFTSPVSPSLPPLTTVPLLSQAALPLLDGRGFPLTAAALSPANALPSRSPSPSDSPLVCQVRITCNVTPTLDVLVSFTVLPSSQPTSAVSSSTNEQLIGAVSPSDVLLDNASTYTETPLTSPSPSSLATLTVAIPTSSPVLTALSRVPSPPPPFESRWLPSLPLYGYDEEDESYGALLISGSTDHTLKRWNMNTGECELTYRGHSAGVKCVAMDRRTGVVVSGSSDSEIRIWDLASGECQSTLIGHTAAVSCLQLDATKQLLVSGGGDRTVRVWDLTSRTCKRVLEHSQMVRSLQFDSRKLVSASYDGQVIVRNLATGEEIQKFNDASSILALQFDDTKLITGGIRDPGLRMYRGGWATSQSPVLKKALERSDTRPLITFRFGCDKLVFGNASAVTVLDYGKGLPKFSGTDYGRVLSEGESAGRRRSQMQPLVDCTPAVTPTGQPSLVKDQCLVM